MWLTREAHIACTAKGVRRSEQLQNFIWLQHEPVIKYGQSCIPPDHGLNLITSGKCLRLCNDTHKRHYNTATASKNPPLEGFPHRWEKFLLKTHLYWPTLHFIVKELMWACELYTPSTFFHWEPGYGFSEGASLSISSCLVNQPSIVRHRHIWGISTLMI